MDKSKAPLFERLLNHMKKEPASFHVPGHKSGQAVEPDTAEWYGSVLKMDLTEISDLDDLHDPREAIAEAERLAADCFGAEKTFFLIGGSTAGNLAMITAVCQKGDILLVQRNAHKSVIHGLMLAGAKAVFVAPQMDKDTGVPVGPSVESVEEALRAYPDAKGLIVTNPNYYGMCMDLRPLADLVHRYGMPLLVDEAHGAHFGLHPDVPPSALSQGADAVVQSTHKMLTSMTMTAMLHLQGTRVSAAAIRQRLTVLQSSSPSYPLMASLDLARRYVHTRGSDALDGGLRAVREFRRRVRSLACYELPVRLAPHASDVYTTSDPFKAALRDRTGTLTGFALARLLEAHGCYAEMADARHVLFAFSLASTEADAARLASALEAIAASHALSAKPVHAAGGFAPPAAYPCTLEPVHFELPPAGDLDREPCWVPMQEAIGLRCASMVVPYPPGVPVLYPNETITEPVVRMLRELQAHQGKIQGIPAQRIGELPVVSLYTR